VKRVKSDPLKMVRYGKTDPNLKARAVLRAKEKKRLKEKARKASPVPRGKGKAPARKDLRAREKRPGALRKAPAKGKRKEEPRKTFKPVIDTHPIWRGPPTWPPKPGAQPFIHPDANKPDAPRPKAKKGSIVQVVGSDGNLYPDGRKVLFLFGEGTVTEINTKERTLKVNWARKGIVKKEYQTEYTWTKWFNLKMDSNLAAPKGVR